MHADWLRQEDYASELKAPPRLRLAFSPRLESGYLRYRDQRAVLLLRYGCGVAVVLYSAFFLVDFLTHRRLTEPVTFLVIFGIASPVTLAPAAATFFAAARSYARLLAAPAVAVNGVALIFSIAFHTQQQLPLLPYEVLILNLMYAFFLSGILFSVAAPLAFGIVLAYLAADAWAGLPGPLVLDRGYVLLAFCVLGSMACYLLERAERRGWLRAQLVQEMAAHDDLTGLRNRRHFYEQGERLLRQARREGKTLGLLFVDVDRFKSYNDSLGHLAGDECLKQIALALQAAGRRPLDIVARLGGDEFVLLLYDLPSTQLGAHAEALRHGVAKLRLPHPGNPDGMVSISIGAESVAPDTEAALDLLLQRADSALYGAKAAGRNIVQMASASAKR